MNVPHHATSQAMRVIALGHFSAPVPPLDSRLAALNVAPLRCAGLEQLPAMLDNRDILLTEMEWLNALLPAEQDTLARRAVKAAGWITLVEHQARFKDQVRWQREGVTHFFLKPLDPERLAALVEDIHDRTDGPPVRVILLDDEESSLVYYGEVMRHAGILTIATSDPLMVLEVLDEHRPDVLVLDIEMPGCRGPELVTIIRQRPAYAHLPVIFLTAMDSMRDQLMARTAAAEDFLSKPVQAELLLTAVESHALRHRALQRSEKLNHQMNMRARLHLEQLRQAIDEHAIVSITDVAGRITYANDRFCTISGYSREELLGQNHRILKSGMHPDSIYKEMWDTIKSGRVWSGEVCNRSRDGRHYWVEATVVPIMGSRGRPSQYISIRTDVTTLKQKEQQLQQTSGRLQEDIAARKTAEAELVAAREVAERANRAKSDFLSSMSHELRTPMNAILGFAQMLEYDEGLTADQHDNVEEIAKAGRHLLDLINEVLDLAKIESGRIDLSMEGVDIAQLAEDCRHIVQPLADTRGIALRIELPPGLSVFADRVRLKQVLLNLLSNAVKYNREQGEVRLDASRREGGRVRIAVTDTGPGIPSVRLKDLFQPFNRLGAEASEVEGTGIGLTITRQLVELMGGEIGVESEAGCGSTFWIEVAGGHARATATQASWAAGTNADAAAPTAAMASERQVCVLGIDDNPSNLKLIAQVLGMRDHIRLVTAHDPELGIELAMAHRPDLILLDINMPGMDGYQVLEVLKADAVLRKIPVVAVTANAMPRDIERGKAAGFVEYLTKPLHIEYFLATIDRLLGDDTPP